MRTHRTLLLFLPAFLVLLALPLTGCKDFSFYGVLGDRIDDTPLQIAPPAASVAAISGTLTFSATGGVPPYSYSVIPAGGTGTINAATGVFSNGTVGDVTIRVTDSKGRTSNALITITLTGAGLAISPVNIGLSLGGSLTFVASGGSPPYTFSLTSSGSGSPTINVPVSGDYVAGLTSGIDTIEVVDAALDTALATVNVTAATPTVDYSLTGFSIPSPVKGGSTVSGATFTVANGGIADGVEDIYYWVYLSDDGTLSSGDTLLDAGSTGALPMGPGVPLGINGTWPLSSGAKNLFVVISAVDDINTLNNSSAAVAVALQLPNYTGTLTHDSGTTAGAAFTGTLTIDNAGPEDGSENVFWTVYASLGDTTIDAGDKIAASGSILGGLAAAAAPVALPVNNTWPAVAGPDYFLVAVITAADEINPAGNQPSDGPVDVTAPPAPAVDYSGVLSNPAAPRRAGSAFSATLTINNGPAAAGSSTVYWSVYASLGNTTIEEGTDKLVGSGSIPGGLPASDTSGPLPINSTWPSSTGDYYLLARIQADDETAPANNTPTSGVLAVGITDYFGSVAWGTGDIAGAAFTGTLTISNNGGPYAVAGGQDLYWNVYASLDAAISVDDKVVASGFDTGGLAAGDTTGALPINNTWPSTPGIYYLILDIFAGDDAVSTNNRPSTSLPVNPPPQPDYEVSFSTQPPWTAIVNAAIGGQIRIQNISGNDGLQPINYSIYRSADKILGGDVLLRSGTQAPLDDGDFVDLSVEDGDDDWPATGQFCFLIAVISAADDSDMLNNTFVSHPTGVADSVFPEEDEPYNNGAAGPPFNDVSALLAAVPLNGTVAIEGLMDAYNLWDSYELRMAAGATRLRMKARWNTSYDDLDLYFSTSSAAYNTTNASIETDPDTEPPGDVQLGFMSLLPATDYELGVNFWLANNTSGSVGQKYVVLLWGLP